MDINQRIAIDPGTKNTRIAAVDTGEIIEEPTLTAVEYGGEVAAVGAEAEKLLNDLPGRYLAAEPMAGGVICDIDLFDIYIRMMIKKLRRGRMTLFPPKDFVAVPAGITDMQKSELRSAVTSAAVRDVVFVEKPLAAAMAAEKDVLSAHASLIMSVGAGAAEAAVVCMGRIIAYRTINAGGDDMDAEIISQIRRSLDVLVGKGSAEKLKKDMGTKGENVNAVVCARNIMTGLPLLANVDGARVSNAVTDCLSRAADSVKQMLAGMPNELYADVMTGGMALTGGGARLPGIQELFESLLGVPVRTDAEPELSVIRGLMRTAAAPDERKTLLKLTEREISQI